MKDLNRAASNSSENRNYNLKIKLNVILKF